MRKSEIWAQKFFILAWFWLDNLFIWLDFDSIFDSIGSKFKSQNYSTRPDSTVNDSGGSWLEEFPTRPIPILIDWKHFKFFCQSIIKNNCNWVMVLRTSSWLATFGCGGQAEFCLKVVILLLVVGHWRRWVDFSIKINISITLLHIILTTIG